MSEINRLGGVSPVSATSQNDRMLEKKINRRIVKEHVAEAKLEENLETRNFEEEDLFTKITAEHFFSKDIAENALERTREAIPLAHLELYSEAELASNSVALSYLAGEELDVFLDYIDTDGKKKLKFQELAEKLIGANEGEEENLIDVAARTVCLNNKSEIYLMLCYLLEDLIRKKSKDKLRDRLKKIIDSFERQESAYLFNFFSFQNILKTSPNSSVNAGMLDKMANISSGNIKLNSLRQSLQFISQALPDDKMYKMVSIFMKFQGKNLKRISTLNEGRENKEELANILQQERNLIILNTLYNQCRRVFFQMKKVTPIDEKYSDLMAQIITVIESSVVTLDSLQNMEKLLGIKQLTLQINKAFIKNFRVLLSKMPQPIFYSESMREKLLDSIQNIVRNIDKMLEPKSTGLSFLRTKSFKKTVL